MAQQRFQRAIVIGGSMAGLLAARVLADHFQHVIIIDRDNFPSDPLFRPGVPQGRHLHGLLGRGNQLLEQFLPGFSKMIVAHGAHPGDFIGDTHLNVAGNWMPRFDANVPTYICSRPLFEWATRMCLTQQHPNVALMPEQEVVDFLATPTQDRITGVRLRSRTSATQGDTTEMTADLVVDASGRHSQTITHLQALGYPQPPVVAVDAHIGYASQIIELPPDAAPDWKVMYMMLNPPTCVRGGVMAAMEKPNTWLVMLIGAGAEAPPTDEEGYREFARQLPFSDFDDVLSHATPLDKVYGYRDTSNMRRYFEQMPRFPESLIVLGDATCALDPVYAQGMTVAAMDAAVLADCLQRQRGTNLKGFSRTFQRKLGQSVNAPWMLASSADFLVPDVAFAGIKPTAISRVMNWYIGRVQHSFPKTRRSYAAFARVINLMASPGTLFHPAVVTRALLSGGSR